eukprot:CAMPEP_0195517636 /NCGR_PEP_ID=MMETSP0794_2-20130614/11139_1 /TAXON_ID=515487 /ORGANISM="Stephanopyxis turris, Strain CCMP 815" /LENGTH=170 /DNA_ID=CAMNT_0040646469 /DNA_START=300 /DNA_END=812 /DNA_ORIENTATION=+
MIGIESSSIKPSARSGGPFREARDLATMRNNANSFNNCRSLRGGNVVLFQENLKYDIEEENFLDAHVFRTTVDGKENGRVINKREKGRSKRITFDTSVNVMPIPKRNEYSDRIRHRLWSNAIEIQENASRNAVEFAAEGWDWRAVTEDDQMYVCTVTGERIHPVHISSEY